ncbi:MAG: hypothetical protein ACRD41_09310 [Candidatus Acidiferrales bacterium]
MGMGRRVRTGPGSIQTGKPVPLRSDPRFQPCAIEPGDELYANGIFEFNISRLIAFISAHPERFPNETVELSEIPDYGSSDRLDDAAVQVADLSRPVILAEIAPARFSLIDGHHRVAKARRTLSTTIKGNRVRCPDHVGFLTSANAYEKYLEYWNSKLP